MDLKQLRTFAHVAELGSLSKAADRLRIAQPALSRQVRLLEDELGVRLFERHGRGMILTEAGETLLERATGVLRQIDAIRADLSTGQGSVRGSVVLGTPPTVGDALAARLVSRFLKQYPDVSVRIVPAFSGYLVDWLQRGDIDLAILYEPDPKLRLNTQPLLAETLYAVASAKERMSSTQRFTHVLQQRLVLPGPQHGLRKLVEASALRFNRTPNIVVEADSLQTMKDLVEMGLGWTILPKVAVHQEVKGKRLKLAPISDPQLTRTLVVAEALGRPTTRAAKVFRSTLHDVINELVKGRIWDGVLLV